MPEELQESFRAWRQQTRLYNASAVPATEQQPDVRESSLQGWQPSTAYNVFPSSVRGGFRTAVPYQDPVSIGGSLSQHGQHGQQELLRMQLSLVDLSGAPDL